MTPTDLTWRVTRDVCALGLALAVAAAWLAGPAGAIGVAAGIALALGNFRWLVSRACATTGTPGVARAVWSVGAGFRLVAFAVLCASLLATEWAHPVALVAGLTMLPCALVGHGLRAARQES
jgi:glucose uptake protein GlcU